MALTQQSKKFWWASADVMNYLTNVVIKPTDRVLEIGPGDCPFRRADVYVDFIDNWDALAHAKHNEKVIKMNVCDEALPFKDKEFDFVYMRHMLEDIWNPFLICKEISRVAKRGYIETPSPMSELGRGVDGGSPPFRGYHHHRFICWNVAGELRIVSKFPIVEYLRFEEEQIDHLLSMEKYWNTHYLWEGEVKLRHLESPFDFQITRDYSMMLKQAIERAKESSDIFFFDINASRKAA
jgi:hypothetical protein